MRILLFGGSGQLGYEIIKRAADLSFLISSPVQSELDITEQTEILSLAKKLKPDLIINCAAHTAVDQAESEPELALKINATGAKNCALAAKATNARLIQLSTDYVFSGDQKIPLKEEDSTKPLSVYGQSKLLGEQWILQEYQENSLIVRTSSLHGARGSNFVRTMLKLFKEKELVEVVDDQWMSPTWAGSLAEILLDLARMPDKKGIVHACDAGSISWFGFAEEILRQASAKGATFNPNLRLKPTELARSVRPAKRPQFSVLDCSRLEGWLARPRITWQEGLARHLSEITFEY
ncbi:MAG TPA: dTDP-4-dehydrorhamnose reductase [Oligoflexia bacterium]|nr:dTDP-4-dehydrorhamnose reductase [Oligoflexia bacterium]HMP26405.1 dTDP-4-dehydrorhamnose reductase [Oligoflexia bacterium]